MTLGARTKSQTDPWVASALTLFFSVAIAYLQPRYAAWFGGSLPAFTRWFLACAPLWIAINACSIVVQLLAAIFKPKRDGLTVLDAEGDDPAILEAEGYEPTLLERLNSWLSFVAVMIFLLGIVALVLPALHSGTSGQGLD